MLSTFGFIHKPDRLHDPKTVLENHFSLDEITQLFTVRHQQGNFNVFANYTEFFKFLNALPVQERQYHEVIFEQPQKLKFDLDVSLGAMLEFKLPDMLVPDYNITMESTPGEKFKHVLEYIIETIKTAFYVSFGVDIDSLIVCTSGLVLNHGRIENVPTKFSAHVIVNGYYVSGPAQAQEFTRRVLEYLPSVYRPFIDAGVNKRIQNFRIVGCHKGDMRVKTILLNEDDIIPVPEDTLITRVSGCELLPDLTAGVEVKRFNTHMCTQDIEKCLEICARNGIMRDNKFSIARGGMFIFTRLRPSYCSLCERTHDSDNTVIVNTMYVGTTDLGDDTVFVFAGCRKYKNEKGGAGVRIGEFTSAIAGGIEVGKAPNVVGKVATEATVNAIGRYCDREIAYAVSHPDSLYPTRTLFDDLPVGQRNIYDDRTLHPMELTRTLVVHAMMKMGKTKMLRDYVTKHFSSKVVNETIRYVSFRQTFSGNIKEKFADFTLYSDVKGPLNQSRLIVQVESLHRLEISAEPPDLLILDECESIFEQFDSGLLKSFNECFGKFQYLLRYSKHVVCMDAYISDRTYRIIDAIRGMDGMIYHHCIHKNATDDQYWLTGDRARWFGILHSCLMSDERVAIQISSLTEARAVEAGIKKKFPDKVVKLYSSETLQSEKREHFADVNTWWKQCDVLMYTPTVSAGVSFELKHFDKCFGWFTDQSCPVETCLQMMGRIRDVKSRSYYIYLAATGSNLPVDIDEIKNSLYRRRENLMKTYDWTEGNNGLNIEYGLRGEIIYHTSDYFKIWLENTRIRNISRNSFVRRFVHMVSIAGARVGHITDDWFNSTVGLSAEDLTEILRDHGIVKAEIKEATCEEVAAARELDEDDVETIRDAMSQQKDVPKEDLRAWEKYRLRADFNFLGVIDAGFVKKYRDPKVRRQYRNVNRLLAYEDPMVAIEQIQAEERAVYTYTMGTDERSQSADIHRKYVFDQHRYAVGLLRICGWGNITDLKYLHRLTVADNLRNNERTYWETIDAACKEFQIKPPSRVEARMCKEDDARFVGLLIAPVNKILNMMYGCMITSKRNAADTYYLQPSDLFTTIIGNEKKPVIKPRPVFDEAE